MNGPFTKNTFKNNKNTVEIAVQIISNIPLIKVKSRSRLKYLLKIFTGQSMYCTVNESLFVNVLPGLWISIAPA